MIQTILLKKLLLLTLLSLGFGILVLAEPVYRKDANETGVPFYSSKKIGEDFEEAQLPKINKAEMQLLPAAQVTCNGHNGIDCEAGADIDGTVICKDGFRDSVERYNLMCRYASLTISSFGEQSGKSQIVPVYIRNSKPVAANNTRVSYTSDMGYQAVLEGPESVAPYTVAEFKLKSHDAVVVGNKLDKTRFLVTCDNCGDELTDESKGKNVYEDVIRSGERAAEERVVPRGEFLD